MESKVCLDTDFLIDFLRDKKSAVDFVKENESRLGLATSYINLFELYYGAFKSAKKEQNLAAISELIKRITLLNLSDDYVKAAGKILAELEMAGRQVDFRDLLIGTVARENNYSVKTNNKKHFEKINGLKII